VFPNIIIPVLEMTPMPSHFHLTVAPCALGRVSGIPSVLSAPPMNLGVIPEAAETPANSTKKGSFHYDWVRGGYLMEWAGPAEFEVWRQEEELAYSIELIASSTLHGENLWMLKRVYVCSHQLSGGQRKYERKFLDWQHKIGSKKMGCRCRIVVKYYPHTSAFWDATRASMTMRLA
jgi:hypothetical protein